MPKGFEQQRIDVQRVNVQGGGTQDSGIEGREWRWLLGVAIAFFAIVLGLNLIRHFTFYSSYDQGIFNQLFWNGTHGRMFQSSLSSQLSANTTILGQEPEVFYHRSGQHFTPALIFWLPLYTLFPSPVTLTVVQVSLVTAAGIVLYLLAREYLEPTPSRWLVVAFYCANAVVGPTLGNFHDIVQIPLLIFGLLLAMEKRWWWLFGVLALCTLAVREDSGVVLFGVGVYMIASRRYIRIGAALCLLCLGYVLWVTNSVMPSFSRDVELRFVEERFGQYVEGDSGSTLDILVGILRNPFMFVWELFSPLGTTVAYLLGQFLPLALFIPVASPASLAMASPPIVQILAAKGVVFSLNLRYAMTVVPGLFYGAIHWLSGRGWQRFWSQPDRIEPRSIGKRFSRWWSFCIVVSLLFCLVYNPNRTLYYIFPDSYQPLVYVSLPEQIRRSQDINQLLRQIPDDASVAASTHLVPHLSKRRELLRFPRLRFVGDDRNTHQVDYAITDLWRLERYQQAFDKDRRSLLTGVNRIEELLAADTYGIIDIKDGVVLMQKGVASNPESLQNWQGYMEELTPLLDSIAEEVEDRRQERQERQDRDALESSEGN